MSGKSVSEELSEMQKLHLANKLEYYKKQYENHKGEWLTDAACTEYWERAKRLADRSNQDIGEKRKLREELQERYGLKEIEAVNILSGVNSRDYVEKYKLIHAVQNMEEWIKPYLEKVKKARNDTNEEN